MNHSLKSFFLILFFIFSLQAISQTRQFQSGVTLGSGVTFLRGNDILDENGEMNLSYGFGLSFQYNTTSLFSIYTNPAFERKGNAMTFDARDEQGNYLGSLNVENQSDYITVPVLARFTFGKKFQFYLNAGPYVAWLLQARTVANALGNNPPIDQDYTDYFEKNDYGLTTGLGIHYPFSQNFSFSAELRNNLGLKDISATAVINNGAILTNNSVLMIGVNYLFGKEL